MFIQNAILIWKLNSVAHFMIHFALEVRSKVTEYKLQIIPQNKTNWKKKIATEKISYI